MYFAPTQAAEAVKTACPNKDDLSASMELAGELITAEAAFGCPRRPNLRLRRVFGLGRYIGLVEGQTGIKQSKA